MGIFFWRRGSASPEMLLLNPSLGSLRVQDPQGRLHSLDLPHFSTGKHSLENFLQSKFQSPVVMLKTGGLAESGHTHRGSLCEEPSQRQLALEGNELMNMHRLVHQLCIPCLLWERLSRAE